MALRMTLAGFACLCATSLAAQEDATGKLTIELNAATSEEAGCKMSFLILNGHDTAIDQAVFETVLFDAEGGVDRLTLFDFGALPPLRPRVRQFVVGQTSCEDLGQVLFNGAQTCSAEGDADLCTDGLSVSSRIGIEVLG
ncbi:hypothetical protein [Sagittula sp. SSi028]|uniref:hypothetical protein n=1 Tax=Sagittula sp. SSi028 TaxID=3400636 RepID=UPI003AF663E4